VAYGTSPAASAMDNELMDHPDVSGQVVNTSEVNFTPDTDGVYYFGFKPIQMPINIIFLSMIFTLLLVKLLQNSHGQNLLKMRHPKNAGRKNMSTEQKTGI